MLFFFFTDGTPGHHDGQSVLAEEARKMMKTNSGAFSPHQIEAMEKACNPSLYPDVYRKEIAQDARGQVITRKMVLFYAFQPTRKYLTMSLLVSGMGLNVGCLIGPIFSQKEKQA